MARAPEGTPRLTSRRSGRRRTGEPRATPPGSGRGSSSARARVPASDGGDGGPAHGVLRDGTRAVHRAVAGTDRAGGCSARAVHSNNGVLHGRDTWKATRLRRRGFTRRPREGAKSAKKDEPRAGEEQRMKGTLHPSTGNNGAAPRSRHRERDGAAPPRGAGADRSAGGKSGPPYGRTASGLRRAAQGRRLGRGPSVAVARRRSVGRDQPVEINRPRSIGRDQSVVGVASSSTSRTACTRSRASKGLASTCTSSRSRKSGDSTCAP